MYSSSEGVSEEGKPDNANLEYEDDVTNLFPTDDEDNEEQCSWWSMDAMFDSDFGGRPYFAQSFAVKKDDIASKQPQSQHQPPQSQQSGAAACFNAAASANNHHKAGSVPSMTMKSWVCEQCNAVNNSFNSIGSEYSCLICSFKYRPAAKHEEHGALSGPAVNDADLYTVWICNHCSWSNDIEWEQCSMCSQTRPTCNELELYELADPPMPFVQSESFQAFAMQSVYHNEVPVVGHQAEDDLHAALAELELNKVQISSSFCVFQQKSREISYSHSHSHSHSHSEVNVNVDADADRGFRLFDELQQYKVMSLNAAANKHEKHDNAHSQPAMLNESLNWNQDFHFIE